MMLNKFISKDTNTIKEVMQIIDNNKYRFVIIVDSDFIFKGIVTDGDIRRSILNDISIDTNIMNILKNDYYCINLETTFKSVVEMFKSDRIEFLPILDKSSKVVNVITKMQFHIMLLEDIEFNLQYPFFELDSITLDHEIYSRPWGFYKSTILSSHAQSKIITVFPYSELSLQEHKKREEHWVIIKGKGKVILGESEIDVYPGKYIYIPKGCKHQIINNSDENIIFSEVQLGEYFGEDDIIRYSDKYGRINKIN